MQLEHLPDGCIRITEAIDTRGMSKEEIDNVDKAIKAIILNSWKMPHCADPFSKIPLESESKMKCEVCGKKLDGMKEDRPEEIGDYFAVDFYPNPFVRTVYVCRECEENDKADAIWSAFDVAERRYEEG